MHAWHCIALRSDRKGQADERAREWPRSSQFWIYLYCTCLVPRVPWAYRGVPYGAPCRSSRHCLGTIRYLGVYEPTSPPPSGWS